VEGAYFRRLDGAGREAAIHFSSAGCS